MPAPYRILGYAIVSSDGMIADSTGVMPNELIFEADKKWYESELDLADAVVQGRHSYEYQANSPGRRRLVLTRKIAALAPDPEFPKGFLWNPAGASFDEACRTLGLATGAVAVLGGAFVYDLFFGIGYDAFHLSRATAVNLPGGVPVFPEVKLGRSPEEVLTQFGYAPGPTTFLDEKNGVTLVSWRPKNSA
jgi:dihydrofolate reductase